MATSSVSTGPVSTAGVTTNSIDVSSIVSQLMTVQSQPVTLLQSEVTSYQSKVTALGTVQGAVNAFQTAVQGLTSASQYQSMTASSTSSAVGASASATAVPGNYSVNVSTLAAAQSLTTAGQSSSTTAIGTGATTTLTFNFGTISGGTLSSGIYSGATFTPSGSATKTVTINSTNNTLSGIAQAINSANMGVTASVINNGGTNPYQLVLTGPTGVANSMQISATGDATISSLLSENPAGTQNLTQLSTATNASLTVNNVPVTQSSNTVSNVVQGLTFNLNATTTTPATVSVGQNTAGITSAITTFVTAYNAMNTAIQGVASYNSSNSTAGVLFGDPMVSNIETQVHEILNQPITGTTSLYSSLSQIGVTFQKDGSLAVNSTQLNNAIATNAGDIASLFATTGKATDSAVSYVGSGSSTQAGTYALNVTQLATQGQVTGSTAAGTTITTGSNDTLNLSVDGNALSVVIPGGTYTASSLASTLQSLINGSATLTAAGRSVNVSQTAGVLTIQANDYGSTSSVLISGGNASTGLLGTPVTTAGLDVAGTINGQAALGTGQTLTSSTGNSSGLSVQINGGSTGSRGTVSFSQGYATSLNNLVTSLLDPYTGPINAEIQGINTSITAVNTQITNWQARLTTIQANLTAQYAALNTMLGTMNQTSSYLTQQLSRLP